MSDCKCPSFPVLIDRDCTRGQAKKTNGRLTHMAHPSLRFSTFSLSFSCSFSSSAPVPMPTPSCQVSWIATSMGTFIQNPWRQYRRGSPPLHLLHLLWRMSSDLTDMPSLIGIFWKCARIGERLSPYVSICCILMAVSILFTTISISPVIFAFIANIYNLFQRFLSSLEDDKVIQVHASRVENGTFCVFYHDQSRI